MVMTEERRYIMKKIISLFLALVLCLSLCACGSGDTDTVVQNTTDEQSTQQSTETSIGQEDSGKYVAYTYDGEEVDLFTVEEVVLMPESYSNGTIALNWKMKVRNTSGEDLLMKESSMRVWYRYLDENGDTLFSNYSSAGYSNTIKAGKAEWIDCSGTPAGWDNADIENVAYIEIYGYTNTLHGSPDYEFTNYITIDISEFFDWNEVISK